MKTWKNAEVVELNINETAWGVIPSDKERGIIIGTHNHGGSTETETETETEKGPSVTPDTLS